MSVNYTGDIPAPQSAIIPYFDEFGDTQPLATGHMSITASTHAQYTEPLVEGIFLMDYALQMAMLVPIWCAVMGGPPVQGVSVSQAASGSGVATW